MFWFRAEKTIQTGASRTPKSIRGWRFPTKETPNSGCAVVWCPCDPVRRVHRPPNWPSLGRLPATGRPQWSFVEAERALGREVVDHQLLEGRANPRIWSRSDTGSLIRPSLLVAKHWVTTVSTIIGEPQDRSGSAAARAWRFAPAALIRSLAHKPASLEAALVPLAARSDRGTAATFRRRRSTSRPGCAVRQAFALRITHFRLPRTAWPVGQLHLRCTAVQASVAIPT